MLDYTMHKKYICQIGETMQFWMKNYDFQKIQFSKY